MSQRIPDMVQVSGDLEKLKVTIDKTPAAIPPTIKWYEATEKREIDISVKPPRFALISNHKH